MKFKLKDIDMAIDHIKYTYGVEITSDVEIYIREEDFEANKIGSYMVFSAVCSKGAGPYDRLNTAKTITVTVEVFPDSENRCPRVTMQESRDLYNS